MTSREREREREEKKKEKKAPSSSASASPSDTFFTTVFVALSLVSFAAIFFIPEYQRNEIYASAVDLDEYVLKDPVNPSLYRSTARSGDTHPTLSALFHATNILRESSGKISDEKRVKAYLSSVEEGLETTEGIYHLVAASSFVKALTPSASEKHYQALLDLIDPASGFRPSQHKTASVAATYQALEAISFLGKIDAFKATAKFESAIRFVRTSKAENLTGYIDSYKAEPTLSATYYAFKTLSKYAALKEEEKADIVSFVLSCQSADGGFLEHSVHNNEERFYTLGSLETTAHAVETLLALQDVDLHSLLLPIQNFPIYNAISFVRSCVSVGSILSRSTDYFASISATDALIELVNLHHKINFETPRSLQVGLFGAGLFFLSLALYYVYRAKLGKVKGFDVHHVVTGSSLLLLVTAAVLKTSPNFSVIPLVFLSGFLMKSYFDNLEDLFKTGEDTVLALALGGSTIYGGFIFFSVYLSPLAFTQMSLYYVLVCWSAVGVFGAVVIAKALLGGQKPHSFYYGAATMSWITNTLILYSLLYSRYLKSVSLSFFLSLSLYIYIYIFLLFSLTCSSQRGLVTLVHHLVTVSGNFFSFYVALPISSLVLIYVAVHVALAMSGNNTLPAPSHPKKK